jgi:uncharacterized protein YdaU (DUF1376 family)
MSVPYIPLYVADYEADTAHLSIEEDGAYMRLLRLCWRTPGCSVPDDPAWIMRKMRCTADEFHRIVAPLISEFFRKERGRIYSPRLSAEYRRIDDLSQKRSEAGRKGGRQAKALKENAFDESKAKANGKHLEPEPEPEISPNGDIDISPVDQVADAFNAYNAAAERNGWQKAQKVTPARRAAMKARLAECGGSEGWRVALEKAEASDFLNGRTPHAFKCHIDFVLQQSSFTKLMEGTYDNRNHGVSGAGTPRRAGAGTIDAFAAVAQRRAARSTGH